MDILKIFVSTLVVLCITAIIFFGLYFLFPGLSDSVFGVSYAHGCTIDGVEERAALKSSMEEMKAGLQETVKDAASSVSDAAGNAVSKVKEAIPAVREEAPEIVEKVKDIDIDTSAIVETVKEAAGSIDTEELKETLSGAEEDVVEFFSSGNGERYLEELKKNDIVPDDFDISKVADSEEVMAVVKNITSFVVDNGIDLGEALSNSKLHKVISGKTDETLETIKGLFAGGQK